MTELKNLVAALKDPDADVPTIMKAARAAWKITPNDDDFARAAKNPKASVKWLLEESDKDFLEGFLDKCAKKGFLTVNEGRSTRAPAPASRANGSGRSTRGATTAESGPREGSKLASAVKLLSSTKGVSKETLETKVGVRADSCLYALKQHGFNIENVGERGNPIYRIA